jgi:hypothetical protein
MKPLHQLVLRETVTILSQIKDAAGGGSCSMMQHTLEGVLV